MICRFSSVTLVTGGRDERVFFFCLFLFFRGRTGRLGATSSSVIIIKASVIGTQSYSDILPSRLATRHCLPPCTGESKQQLNSTLLPLIYDCFFFVLSLVNQRGKRNPLDRNIKTHARSNRKKRDYLAFLFLGGRCKTLVGPHNTGKTKHKTIRVWGKSTKTRR